MIYIYIYIFIFISKDKRCPGWKKYRAGNCCDPNWVYLVAIFYPFSQFCEINISLLSLQTQPNTAPNLFQRGVEYGKYAYVKIVFDVHNDSNNNHNNVIIMIMLTSNNSNNNNDNNDSDNNMVIVLVLALNLCLHLNLHLRLVYLHRP